MQAYGVGKKAAGAAAPRLLKRPEIKKELERLAKLKNAPSEALEEVSRQFILDKLIEIAGDAKRKGDQLKALELLGKTRAMFSDKLITEDERTINIIHNIPRPEPHKVIDVPSKSALPLKEG